MDVRFGSVGCSVNCSDNVTPPPETEIVTTCGSDTRAVLMSKKPTPLPANTVAELGTAARAGLLLLTCTS
jgi:hypothetical protein